MTFSKTCSMTRLKAVTIGLSVAILAACGGGEESNNASTQTAAKAQRDCTLKFGWESRQPYQFEQNGKVQGIDIEVFTTAANSANCDVQFVQKSWAELLTGLEKGEVDVLGGATPTEERQVYATFSDPYRSESFTLFIETGDDYTGDNLSGFLSRGNKIGVTSDYFYGKEVYDLMQHPQYSQLFVDEKSGEKSFYNIIYSRIDGVLSDPIEGNYIIKRKGLDKQIKASNVVIPSDSVSFMFSKKSVSDELANKLKSNIKQLVSDNKVQAVIGKY